MHTLMSRRTGHIDGVPLKSRRATGGSPLSSSVLSFAKEDGNVALKNTAGRQRGCVYLVRVVFTVGLILKDVFAVDLTTNETIVVCPLFSPLSVTGTLGSSSDVGDQNRVGRSTATTATVTNSLTQEPA